MIRKFIVFGISLCILFGVVSFAYADSTQTNTNSGSIQTNTNPGSTQTNTNPGSTQTNTNTNSVGVALTNPLNASSLTGLLQEVLQYVTTLGSIFLVMMIVYVGFLFVMARGNSEKVSQARQALLWTVIGALLLLGASALAAVITTTITNL